MNKVREFMEICGQDVNKPELLGTKTDSFRLSLIVEEGDNEYKKAIEEQNRTEFIDSLGDNLYVVYGTAITYGIDILDHESSKIDRLYDDIHYVFNNDKDVDMNYYNMMSNLIKSISFESLSLLQHSLQEIVNLVIKISKIYDINIKGAFDLIHKSNMTKFCDNEKDAIDTINWYKLNDNRYPEPSYRLYNDKYIIYEKTTTKVIKSIYYIPVDLSNF
jgi:predicted HAD superfamily Cof-like phosphohydrolase